MNENKPQGKCLCGAVTCVVDTIPDTVEACHCTMCRQWGGGPLLVAACGTSVRFEGGDHISVFESSAWAERAFCAVCGTHLFYRLKQQGQYYIPAGLLGEIGPLHFEREVFIDHKPDFYSFANDTEKLTGEELFAQFAAEQ